MVDSLNSSRRSWNMSRIRSTRTAPERAVCSLAHRMGYRFRHSTGRRLIGRPDLVLPRFHVAVFVHGCFWHRHTRCKLAYTPKSRVDFWKKKFASNVARDIAVRCRLRRDGWTVITIWECEIPTARARRKLSKIRRSDVSGS